MSDPRSDVPCPECGANLYRVTYQGGYLNEDQWDSIRAGDYFCKSCPPNQPLPHRYFWESDLPASPVGSETAPSEHTLIDGIPRRIRIDHYIPAETAIRSAILEVEEAGAHPLLTDAVILLGQAQEKVADWFDGLIGAIPAAPPANEDGINRGIKCAEKEGLFPTRP